MKTKILILTIGIMAASAEGAAQKTPQELGERWIASIRAHSAEKFMPLIHPKCPKSAVNKDAVQRMVSGEVAPRFFFETLELGDKELLKKMYSVVPEKQLNLKFRTASFEEQKKYGIGKGLPIARYKGDWYFVACTKTLAKR